MPKKMKLNKKMTPLRYPGGKSNALGKLDPVLLKTFKEYREPFVGGASVALWLMQQNKTATYWLNDLFYPVYCFWKMVDERPEELLARIQELKKPYVQKNDVAGKKGSDGKKIPSRSAKAGEELFNETNRILRELDRTRGDEFETAVRAYIFNKLSFSGFILQGTYSALAWDQNFSDSCNLKIVKAGNLFRSVKEAGGTIRITNLDYDKLLNKDGKGVFIFLDPPYDLKDPKEAKINLYGPDGTLHEKFSHVRFTDDMHVCTKHKWLITYNREIRPLFEGHGYHMEDSGWTYTMRQSDKVAPENQPVVQYKEGKKPEKTGKIGKELFVWNYDI